MRSEAETRFLQGRVFLEAESGMFCFRSPDKHTRRQAASLIRRLNPDAALRIEAGNLLIDLPTALALHSDRFENRLSWDEDALRFIETAAASYVNIARARAIPNGRNWIRINSSLWRLWRSPRFAGCAYSMNKGRAKPRWRSTATIA